MHNIKKLPKVPYRCLGWPHMSGSPDTDVNRACLHFLMLCLSLKEVCVCVRFCAVTVFWTRRSTGWRTIRRSAELGSWRTSMMAAALQWVSLTYHTPRSAEIIYTHMSIRLINGACVCDCVEVRWHLYCVQPSTDKCALDWGDNVVWCWLWLNNICSNSLNWENTFSCTWMTAALTVGWDN